jgi:general stress protein YciG
MAKPGPEPGSDGARRIAEAHKGSHDHDRNGGFASKPGSAQEAGKKGGDTVKTLYGHSFYQNIGKKGGETVKRERGANFYAEIGRKGGEMRGARAAERRAAAESANANGPHQPE